MLGHTHTHPHLDWDNVEGQFTSCTHLVLWGETGVPMETHTDVGETANVTQSVDPVDNVFYRYKQRMLNESMLLDDLLHIQMKSQKKRIKTD